MPLSTKQHLWCLTKQWEFSFWTWHWNTLRCCPVLPFCATSLLSRLCHSYILPHRCDPVPHSCQLCWALVLPFSLRMVWSLESTSPLFSGLNSHTSFFHYCKKTKSTECVSSDSGKDNSISVHILLQWWEGCPSNSWLWHESNLLHVQNLCSEFVGSIELCSIFYTGTNSRIWTWGFDALCDQPWLVFFLI